MSCGNRFQVHRTSFSSSLSLFFFTEMWFKKWVSMIGWGFGHKREEGRGDLGFGESGEYLGIWVLGALI